MLYKHSEEIQQCCASPVGCVPGLCGRTTRATGHVPSLELKADGHGEIFVTKIFFSGRPVCDPHSSLVCCLALTLPTMRRAKGANVKRRPALRKTSGLQTRIAEVSEMAVVHRLL